MSSSPNSMPSSLNSTSLPAYDDYDMAISTFPNLTPSNITLLTPERAPLHIVISMTVLYGVIFFLSALGNTTTIITIVHNGYMHTTTNYYLLNLAISDLLLLITGLPFELYSFWRPHGQHVFGEAFCVLRGLCAETSTNASILTIVSFTVERYLAICHPLLQHTFSGLSRAIRCIVLVWAVSLLCALFPALQFGIMFERDEDGRIIPSQGRCTVVREVFPHVFEASSVLFFFMPMLIITLLYIQIGLRLRRHLRRCVARASLRGRTSAGVLAARSAVVRMLGELLRGKRAWGGCSLGGDAG
ncbi:pyrokinin-1 receptor-like, partial [Amphibalanus amphitrite]|uniref:pyrokinin-1 receptor-like n=1 Tax=Amphibalanus amphitrite TaxID=1232801 RepID=UPI001C90A9DB